MPFSKFKKSVRFFLTRRFDWTEERAETWIRLHPDFMREKHDDMTQPAATAEQIHRMK